MGSFVFKNAPVDCGLGVSPLHGVQHVRKAMQIGTQRGEQPFAATFSKNGGAHAQNNVTGVEQRHGGRRASDVSIIRAAKTKGNR